MANDFIVDPPSDSCSPTEASDGASITSAVTYDGNSLECLPISKGMNMNSVMLALEAVCLQNHSQFVTYNTRITNIESWMDSYSNPEVYTSDVKDASTYTCIGTNGSLLDTLSQIDDAICALEAITSSGGVKVSQDDFTSYVGSTGVGIVMDAYPTTGGIVSHGTNSSTIDTVRFSTNDGKVSTAVGTALSTASTRDNYIYAESTTSTLIVKDVPLGDPAPVVADDEIVLHKISLDGAGAVTSTEDLREYNSITAANIRSGSDLSAFIPAGSITGSEIDLSTKLVYDSVVAISNPADIVHKDYVDAAVATMSSLWTAAGVDVYINTGKVAVGDTADALADFYVNGSIRYVDGNEASGYVLTSDTNGYASWSALSLVFTGKDEGTTLNSFDSINFIGAGVTAVDGGSGVLDVTITGSVSGFTDLSDTPATYVGSGDFFLRVNTGENSVDFVDGSTINISTFNNDSGFITSYTEIDDLENVLSRDNSTGAYDISILSGQSIKYNNSGFTATILESTLAGNIVLSLPAVSGSVALLSDIAASVGAYLPLAGGTMTGAITMAAGVAKISVGATGGILDLDFGGTGTIAGLSSGLSLFSTNAGEMILSDSKAKLNYFDGVQEYGIEAIGDTITTFTSGTLIGLKGNTSNIAFGGINSLGAAFINANQGQVNAGVTNSTLIGGDGTYEATSTVNGSTHVQGLLSVYDDIVFRSTAVLEADAIKTVQSTGVITWDGTTGGLFAITDDKDNQLFGVADVSGNDIMYADADWLIQLGNPFAVPFSMFYDIATGDSTLTTNAINVNTNVGTITSTVVTAAIVVTDSITKITTTTAADLLSLPDGVEGQEMALLYYAETAIGDILTITPTNLIGYTTITMNSIGEGVELYFTGGSWIVKSNNGTVLA